MKNQSQTPANTQSGSVIILIFVMIALFAALSYALSKGSRTGAGFLTAEQSKLAATEILEYATAVRNAIKTMMANGVPVQNICVVRTQYYLQNGTQVTTGNDNCTSDTCRVFKPQGGGVNERNFYDYATMDTGWNATYPRVGSVEFIIAGVDGVGSTKPEIIMRIMQVKPEICTAINVMMGIGPEPVADTGDGGSDYDLYGNDVTASLDATDANTFGITETRLKGKKTFCDNSNRIVFSVINAR